MEALVPTELCGLRGSLPYTITTSSTKTTRIIREAVPERWPDDKRRRDLTTLDCLKQVTRIQKGPAAVVQRWDQDMRLTTTTNVSVDGVMEGLGGPDEDRSGGFERGGWAIPLLDTETGNYLNQVYGGAAAFLFGRRTYEIFAGSWGAMADPSTSPIAAALNSRPKYVASTSLADPQWAGTTVLHGDVATAVGDLKAHQERHTAGARQRCPRPMAARQRPGRPTRPAHLSRRHRPGHTTVPLFRSGRRTRPGQLADHFPGHHHPDLSASRASGVRNVHGRPRTRHARRDLGSAQLKHAQDPSTPHRRPSCSALDLVVCRSTSTPNRFRDSVTRLTAKTQGRSPVHTRSR